MMLRWTNVIRAALFFVLPVQGAYAAELHVPADYSNIQTAINAAVDGDVIVIAPGTYNESLSISDKSITIRSSAGGSRRS